MFSKIILVLAVASNFALGSIGQAQSTQTYRLDNGRFTIGNGQTHDVDFSPIYIRKLFVQAAGYSSDSTFEVIANGDVKGTIHVPGRDPSYVVTINENVSSLQFRHISGGYATVTSIDAVVLRSSPTWPVISAPPDSVAALARQAIELIECLRPYANLKDQVQYLFPIKKAAAVLYATATARGDISYHTRLELMNLEAKIDRAEAYLQDSFERDVIFDKATELLALRETIDRALN